MTPMEQDNNFEAVVSPGNHGDLSSGRDCWLGDSSILIGTSMRSEWPSTFKVMHKSASVASPVGVLVTENTRVMFSESSWRDVLSFTTKPLGTSACTKRPIGFRSERLSNTRRSSGPFPVLTPSKRSTRGETRISCTICPITRTSAVRSECDGLRRSVYEKGPGDKSERTVTWIVFVRDGAMFASVAATLTVT
jgi:hypothetical protein